MAVKVLVERTAQKGAEEVLPSLLRQLRGEAMHQPGYMYGETLRMVRGNRRTFLVISTWSRLEHWEAWEQDPFRCKMEVKLDSIVQGKAKVRVFEEYVESLDGPKPLR